MMKRAFRASRSLPARRRDPYLACNFLVEIEGLIVGGFSEVGGLEVEVDLEEYQEGGQNGYVHQFASRARYPHLNLKHGMTDADAFWWWQQEVVDGKFERRNGTIYLLDRQRLPKVWWNFKKGYPVKWSGPELRADSGDVAVESVELVHQGLSRGAGS